MWSDGLVLLGASWCDLFSINQYLMGLLTTWPYLPHNSLFIFWEGFPSGQRDQTVNLTAQPSEVRILPPPPPGKLETTDLKPHIDFGVYWEQKDHGPMRHSAPDTLVSCASFSQAGVVQW